MRPGGDRAASLRDGARIELGLRRFFEAGPFIAFTDTFEDLHGLTQLPGLAVQRLMADGYGFGAEGDWKTAAMVRAMKVMSTGLPGGVSFMEDYTYHFGPDGDLSPGRAHAGGLSDHRSRQAAAGDPSALHRRQGGSGAAGVRRASRSGRRGVRHGHGRSIPDGRECRGRGPAGATSPRLPVARAMWKPRPDLKTNAAAWILAGGSHHTSLGFDVTPAHLRDFAAMSGTECLVIDESTRLEAFADQLRWNDLYHHLAKGI
ncbi:MAG: hypothetical protein WKF78_01240 [Candidatus Limnocylindrales bacterium]